MKVVNNTNWLFVLENEQGLFFVIPCNRIPQQNKINLPNGTVLVVNSYDHPFSFDRSGNINLLSADSEFIEPIKATIVKYLIDKGIIRAQ